ncbi:MAG TPA: secondary thiamine-phosphate synthase enzyme YjbQ [Xanthobacteraceae bacterium]|jgi:secondary thiamine-phosphate synthase enzyme
MRHRGDAVTQHQLSELTSVAAEIVAAATLIVKTGGQGFTEITDDAARFIAAAGARDGALLLYLRHTSASLVIQENADPDVRADLATALDRLVPPGQHWLHDSEGPDDMPSHVRTMLTGVSLHVPVAGGALLLGHWQGIYLAEHRTSPRRREVVLQFIGSRR